MKKMILNSALILLVFGLIVGVSPTGISKAEAAEPSDLDVALPPVQPVPFVDLGRYVGTWYEIASIPQDFQKMCASDVTADYAALEDGTIRVTNACRKADGSMKFAIGNARVVDRQTHAKLRVRFVRVFGEWVDLFGGDYWVIDLASDYSYSVVAEGSRKFGWILSRTPVLSNDVLVGINNRLVAQGYNTCQFLTTVQNVPGSTTKRVQLCHISSR